MKKINVPYNYLPMQFGEQTEEYLELLREWIPTGEYTLGPYVEKFEKQFGEYIGVKHVISVNNGTDALILCLKSLGIKAGDEVITVANTFVATAGAIVAVGAKPVFVDSDDRYQIAVDKIEKAITPKTKAIMPVHWAGCSPDMAAIVKIGEKHKIPVIEDACPAVGASINGKKAGSFGLINAFSMHPLKPLNVMGDGGMVVTNDDKLADWMRLYRNHGLKDRDHVEIWGVNMRLQPFQAVVAMRQLSQIEQIAEKRNRNARILDQGLSKLEKFVKLPSRPAGYREVYQLYLASFARRDELVKYLVENGIEAKVHYPIPLHLQNAAKQYGYKAGDFPVAEQQAKEVITLPSHQHLTEEQMNYTVDRIRAFYL